MSFTKHANTHLQAHNALFHQGHAHQANSIMRQSITTAPIFTIAAGKAVDADTALPGYRQFGLLGQQLDAFYPAAGKSTSKPPPQDQDRRVFINGDAPQSAFICGVQGSGKSNTLACILENFLIPSTILGHLPAPLRGLVFHYDQHAPAACEASYLASHLPVTVLVPPSSLARATSLYAALPGANQRVKVHALRLKEKDLNLERMLNLMAVNTADDKPPLYMEIVRKILRSMANTATGFNYTEFLRQLKKEKLSPGQEGPLNLRLEILESFMATTRQEKKQDLWDIKPGCLVIVDLSDPFIDEGTACSLFDICLNLFLSRPIGNGTVVALDEAHKYMSTTLAAEKFTQTLLSTIRLQRHLGTRVLISTQEPTISGKLLDLCTFTLVHRFTSPEWLGFLRLHIAAVGQEDTGDVMRKIMALDCGEALLFAPNAVMTVKEAEREDLVNAFGALDIEDAKENGPYDRTGGINLTKGERKKGKRSLVGEVENFGLWYLKVKIRKRITNDGGQSVMAIR